jgi:hypothetical protein
MRKLSVALVAVALVFGFTVSAMAAQGLIYTSAEQLPTTAKMIDVYGSVRMQTFWLQRNSENTGTGHSDGDLTWDLDDGSSRFGVRFKAGKVGANVEIRPRDRQTVLTRTLSAPGQGDLMRHWYGSYDMGWGTFIVGQTWTPTFNPICNECLVGGGGILDGYGDMGGSARQPGLQLHMPVKAMNGLVKIALLKPYIDPGPNAGDLSIASAVRIGDAIDAGTALPNLSFGPEVAPAGYTSTDTTIPKIEASVAGAFGPLSFTVRGGFNSIDYKNAATDDTKGLTSWLGALDLTYAMGPFYVRGDGYIGQNMTTYGTGAPPVAWGLFPQSFGGPDIEDVSNWGWFGVAGFKINDMFAVEAGYGQRGSSQDYLGDEIKDKTKAFVLFVPISITPAFVITPELLWTDEGYVHGPAPAPEGVRYSEDRGNKIYAGIYWRIDF